jgi:putative acetyltransferase
LYTHPEFERRGIGTELLGLAEELMRDAGVEVIRLEASSNAEEFYLRRGYLPAGPRPVDGATPLVKRLNGEVL